MSEDGVFQVVMLPVMRPAFERWLEQCGFLLYRMPDDAQNEDDLPVYGIGVLEAAGGESLWPLNTMTLCALKQRGTSRSRIPPVPAMTPDGEESAPPVGLRQTPYSTPWNLSLSRCPMGDS